MNSIMYIYDVLSVGSTNKGVHRWNAAIKMVVLVFCKSYTLKRTNSLRSISVFVIILVMVNFKSAVEPEVGI